MKSFWMHGEGQDNGGCSSVDLSAVFAGERSAMHAIWRCDHHIGCSSYKTPQGPGRPRTGVMIASAAFETWQDAAREASTERSVKIGKTNAVRLHQGIEGSYITYHPDYSPDDDDPLNGVRFVVSPSLGARSFFDLRGHN